MTTIAGLNDPIRAYKWSDDAWDEISWTHRGADAFFFTDSISVWTGQELVTGGHGGLVSWNPNKEKFAHKFDDKVWNSRSDAVWTGKEVVSLTSLSSKGFIWTPPVVKP